MMLEENLEKMKLNEPVRQKLGRFLGNRKITRDYYYSDLLQALKRDTSIILVLRGQRGSKYLRLRYPTTHTQLVRERSDKQSCRKTESLLVQR